MALSAEDRAWLASKGICVSCGKRPAMPGKSTCEICRERRIDKYYKKRNPDADSKICPACGKNPREFAQSRCKKCLEKKDATPKKDGE